MPRSEAFTGVTAESYAARAGRSVAAMEAGVHLVAPEAEERMLAAAGFGGVAMFWQAFAQRGWVACA